MIKNNKFDQELLGKIKKEKIIPKPKWQFLLKDFVIWGAGIISLIVGGLANSVIIYLLRYNDWGIYSQISDSLLEFVLLTLPYFWMLFFAFFVFVIYYNIKHTKKGYRYPLSIILTASIIISIILGAIFFKAGMGQAIDDVLGEKAPFYEKIINRQMRFWSRPEQGRLSGLIISELSNNEFILIDLNHMEWIVKTEKTIIAPNVKIEAGVPIKLDGKQLSENIFYAKKIILISPGRGLFERQKNKLPAKSIYLPKQMDYFE